ncbi:L-selectin-like [Thunnus albacares]|uniref:L-selectin-like n=1 Tax=Thunnus albacares TaxID=8236 RepID=UPI001CF65C5B|nr:L-selectin-like [Thunnus albacares]
MQWSLFLLILMGSFLTCQLYEYHFIEKQKTWYDAQKYCKEKYTDLATVYDMTDVRRLCKFKENQQEAWIGLHNMPGTGNIEWYPSSVENNEHGPIGSRGQENDERCLRIKLHDGHLDWVALPCTQSYRSICHDGENSCDPILYIFVF